MDFYQIQVREIEKGPNKGRMEIYPDFKVGRSKDLMVRGKAFYAIWDEAAGLWSTDEYDVQRLVDMEMRQFAEKRYGSDNSSYLIRDLRSFGSQSWKQFRQYVALLSDNSHELDSHLTFANTQIKKADYVSKRLPYSLESGDYSAWDELIGTLYSVEERAKIEWAIGAIVSGDAKSIQKFLVLYGPAGTGKSTMLNIVEKLFEGYTTTFEAKALGSNGNAFATEAFKSNPLVAIQHDGDLSRIQDNTKLNSIISHEYMQMNEKYKPSYTARVNAFLLMGTNQPVKISDAKSGIIRRLIDVHPTGVKIPVNHYHTLMARVDFELGAIAHHCLEVYREMGKNYYNSYRPTEMMLQTDVFFNFIEANFDIFKEQDGVTLRQAYIMYKEFCADTGIEKVLPQYKVREELRNYFEEFKDRGELDGQPVRSYYHGFTANKFKEPSKTENVYSLVMEETESLLDEELANQPAQLAGPSGNPRKKWENVTTVLGNLDTTHLHFVKVPESHIVIDFDLKDESGEKSLDRNLEAASVWPATYAELSKSGSGVHLHYKYTGDVSSLRAEYSEGIEVKTLLGDASLRRKLTKCNAVPIAELNIKLPEKEKKVLDVDKIQSERGLRELIARNLRKEIHPSTKSSVDFIKHILDEMYESGDSYDVSDLYPKLLAFANNSTNQSIECLRLVQQMKLKSESELMGEDPGDIPEPKDERLVHYDLEVYPNLFVVCWKYDGEKGGVRMINPSPQECEQLLNFRLIGFNNRRYDNHILYARIQGYTNEELYNLSQKLINNDRQAAFGNAYNLSYADIWDFSSEKMTLKKFQIKLGIHHQEMDLPWDQPVPEDRIADVVEYCMNDVESQEVVFHHRKADFVARRILADLSGLSVNDTTQRHTARIIFGNDRHPQASFIYTKLAKEFPGYEFDQGQSTYRGEIVGEGGYVYAEPGIYENVVELDVASMHPTSIEQLNLFGEYTPNFSALKSARIAIKHKDYDTAKGMLNGRLAPYLEDPADAEALSYALKIVINIVYGLTAAKFDNPFKDVRNKDNIVAKRGALFMVDLKHAVQEQGFQVVHIKTDSIKIPNATPEIIDFIMQFGEKYGYEFENDGVYEKFCLVDDAQFIARKNGEWKAVGAKFQHPFVFKSLFQHDEEIGLGDLCEPKSVVQGHMFLDFEHDRAMATLEGMLFVGKTGLFVPVKEGGGILYRVKDDKTYSVTGTKGFLWVEKEMFDAMEEKFEIDMSYFEKLADSARKTIEKFGDYDEFIK
jgi:hypothetical protein